LRVVTSARGWPKKRRESRPPNQALHMTGPPCWFRATQGFTGGPGR
jgi:hypothetical protein